MLLFELIAPLYGFVLGRSDNSLSVLVWGNQLVARANQTLGIAIVLIAWQACAAGDDLRRPSITQTTTYALALPLSLTLKILQRSCLFTQPIY